MIFFFILSHIFLFANQNKFTENDRKIVPKIFMEDFSSSYDDENTINNFSKPKVFIIKENFELSNNNNSDYGFIRYDDYFESKNNNYVFTKSIKKKRREFNIILFNNIFYSFFFYGLHFLLFLFYIMENLRDI